MSIEDSLRHMLGESAANVIYFYLERDFSIRKDEIPKKLEDFDVALKKIFGAGALTLEKIIEVQLYTNLHIKYEDTEDNFIDKVRAAMQIVTQKNEDNE